jgi:uncharacterized tellurite resistance protein B-like protein
MNYSAILTRLYFLLIHADGNVNEREISTAKQMVKAEAMHEVEFSANLELLKSKDKEVLVTECMEAMRKLEHKLQIRMVAWLCVIANADGFMDRAEWQLIYRIYHNEIGLPLHEIFEMQKELNKLIWEQSSHITIL